MLLLCAFNLNAQSFNIDDLKTDLDFLWGKVHEIHPNPYLRSDSTTISVFKNELISSTSSTIDSLQYRRLLASFISQFNDGHSYINIPSEYWKTNNFPFTIKIDNERIFVHTNNSSNALINPKDEILKINSVNTVEILNTLIACVSSEGAHTKRRSIEKWFSTYLSYYYGWDDKKYEIQLKNNGVTLEDTFIKTVTSEGDITAKETYVFKIVDNSTAYVDINAFIYKKRFKQFLKKSFRTIQNKGISELYIDLRDNGGGNSILAHHLMNYLTDKEYTLEGDAIWKSSKQSRTQYRKEYFGKWYMKPFFPLSYLFKEGRIRLIKSDGQISEIKQKPIKPKNKKSRFSGTVYVIVNGTTNSTASAFSNAIGCYNIGKLTGNQMGESNVSTGNTIWVQTPQSKIYFSISATIYLQPCGNIDKPNEYLKPNILLDVDEMNIEEVIKQTKNI